jgi:hypothetical protein
VGHRQALEKRHRRADGEWEDHEGVIVEFGNINELERSMTRDRLERRKLAEVGVTPSAHAKHRRADRDVFDVPLFEQTHARAFRLLPSLHSGLRTHCHYPDSGS